nr:BRO family protein [uncultured Cohaesibacter sp.]
MLKKANPSTELSTFTFHNREYTELEGYPTYRMIDEHEIRTITFADKPNDPWFVAADVCMVLGLAINPKTGTVAFQPSRYPNLTVEDVDQHRVLMNLRDGRQQRRPMWCLSESGLYKLVMRSDKPQAKAFQDWVTRDVLPAIRKNGGYVKGQEKLVTGEMSNAEFMAKALQMADATLKDAQAKIASLESQTETLIQQKGELAEDNAALEAVKAQMEPMVEKYRQFLCVDGTFNKEAAAGILGFRSAIMFNRWP